MFNYLRRGRESVSFANVHLEAISVGNLNSVNKVLLTTNPAYLTKLSVLHPKSSPKSPVNRKIVPYMKTTTF